MLESLNRFHIQNRNRFGGLSEKGTRTRERGNGGFNVHRDRHNAKPLTKVDYKI
jgi:hypothetical protein